MSQPISTETLHAADHNARQVVPDLSRPRSNNHQRKSSAQATGRRASAAVSDSSTGLRRLLACDIALSTLSLAPAAFAQGGPGKIQGGSSAVSDLLAKKAKRTPLTASPSQASPETSSQVEKASGPAAAPAEPPSALPDAANLKETASKLSDQASEAAGQATSAASKLTDKASDPAGQATSAASKLAETGPQAPGPADSAVSKIQDAASSSSSSIQEGAADLANSVQPSTGPTLKPPSLTYPSGSSSTSSGGGGGDVGKQASDAVEQLSKQASEAADNLSQQAAETLQSASSAADQATAGVRQSFTEVAGDAGEAVQRLGLQLGQQLSEAASTAKAALPAPIQQALDAVTPALDSAVHQIQSDSRLSTAAVAIGVSLPVVLWFRARYGGYGGPLSAAQAFELLQETDAIFVDIRPDEQREADGVAELKRGARRKGVVVPFNGLPASTSRQLRRPNEVAAQLAAVQIASLAQIGSKTNIIVVDDRGKDAIRIARSLRQFGRAKAYVLEGGFKSWVRQGLPVREGTVYGTSVLETFSEDVEVFAENANTIARSPAALIALLAAVGGTGATIYDYHKALQFLGVLGLLVTAVLRYNSFKELAQDLYGGIKNIGKAADAVASVPAVASAGASSLNSASSSLTSSFQDTSPSESFAAAEAPEAATSPTAAPVSSPSSNGDSAAESYEPAVAKDSGEEEKPQPVPVSSPPEPSKLAGPSQPDDSEKAAQKAQPEEEQRLDEDAGKAKEATPLPSESNK